MASFASSILSSRDHPTLVIGALQLVDLLLMKVPSLYKPTFRREGVFYEIDSLASRTLSTSKSKDKTDKESSEGPSDSGTAAPSSATLPPFAGLKKLASLSMDPDDAITLRARVIRFKYLSDEAAEADGTYDALRRLVDSLSRVDASEQELEDALWQLAELFASPHTSVSSFELLQTGVVDGLLEFSTDTERIGKSIPSLWVYSSH